MSFHEEFRRAAERRNSLPPWARPVVTRPMTPARPAAGDTRTDRERVREAVVRGLARAHGASYVEWADAVLALPELGSLLDAAEKVRRVEALVSDAERFPEGDVLNRVSADNLRFALDGPQ